MNRFNLNLVPEYIIISLDTCKQYGVVVCRHYSLSDEQNLEDLIIVFELFKNKVMMKRKVSDVIICRVSPLLDSIFYVSRNDICVY